MEEKLLIRDEGIEMNTMGSRIRRLRESTGMSAKFASEKLMISASRYSNWENDISKPKPEELEKIVDFYETSYDYLYGKTDEPHLSLNEYKMQQMVDNKILKILGLSTEEIEGLSKSDFDRIIDYTKLVIQSHEMEKLKKKDAE